MDAVASKLVEALTEQRPVVLFLGQDYATPAGGSDPVLAAFLGRIGIASQLSLGWPAALGTNVLTDQDFEWLGERFQRNVPPPVLEGVFDVAWSGVFTTSIDPKFVNRFETRGRIPESILAKDHFSRVPRSRSRPAVHHLLGRVNEVDAAFRSPRSKFELRQRIAIHASQLINRIAETVTPLGLLVVDGFHELRDWLPIDDLLAPLSQSIGLQILWFGESTVPHSDFFSELTRRGTLLSDSRRLSDLIADIQLREKSDELGIVFHRESGTVSLSADTYLTIPPSLRLRVEAAAAVVDDTWTDPQPLPSHSTEIESFRRFHGDFGGARTLVEGIGHGYAIKREFETKLLTVVTSAIRDQGKLDNFAVVHGQSGVGKSIALARLAKTLREEHRLPVLFSWGRIPMPNDLDEFCEECERAGAIATVVICDANQAFERYRELTNGVNKPRS